MTLSKAYKWTNYLNKKMLLKQEFFKFNKWWNQKSWSKEKSKDKEELFSKNIKNMRYFCWKMEWFFFTPQTQNQKPTEMKLKVYVCN
jgi:hypothetical protein